MFAAARVTTFTARRSAPNAFRAFSNTSFLADQYDVVVVGTILVLDFVSMNGLKFGLTHQSFEYFIPMYCKNLY